MGTMDNVLLALGLVLVAIAGVTLFIIWYIGREDEKEHE